MHIIVNNRHKNKSNVFHFSGCPYEKKLKEKKTVPLEHMGSGAFLLYRNCRYCNSRRFRLKTVYGSITKNLRGLM